VVDDAQVPTDPTAWRRGLDGLRRALAALGNERAVANARRGLAEHDAAHAALDALVCRLEAGRPRRGRDAA
jgi:hypothetical protein